MVFVLYSMIGRVRHGFCLVLNDWSVRHGFCLVLNDWSVRHGFCLVLNDWLSEAGLSRNRNSAAVGFRSNLFSCHGHYNWCLFC